MTGRADQARDALLLGSLPVASVEEASRTVGAALGDWPRWGVRTRRGRFAVPGRTARQDDETE